MTEPTDAEAWEMWLAQPLTGHAPKSVGNFARAVLTKWGTPPAVAGEHIPEWAKPHPRCDAGCMFQCTKGFAEFPSCATTPQPTQAQAGAVPLNHKNIEPVRRFLADRGIYLSDETTKALIVAAHGIKGGQHG